MNRDYTITIIEVVGVLISIYGLRINPTLFSFILLGIIVFEIYNFFNYKILTPIKTLQQLTTQLKNRLDLLQRLDKIERRIDKIENKKNHK